MRAKFCLYRAEKFCPFRMIQSLNGILCIDKPQNFTSFDVIGKLRGMTQTKKIGHAGTLDPMATGVLPVLFGNATKAADLLPNQDKRYTAEFRLGISTNTQDIWGEITSETESHVTKSQILEKLPSFTGVIRQIPPMFSAVQIKGQRLYDLARKGIEVKREPREITIYSLSLLSFDEETQTGSLDIFCAKGTYIRTLCHDIGTTLGVGGTMTALIRTEAAGFTSADCFSFEEVQILLEKGTFANHLLPVEQLFMSFPDIHLNAVQSEKFANGVRLDLNRVDHQRKEGFHRVYHADGHFLGLASCNFETMELLLTKFFTERKDPCAH